MTSSKFRAWAASRVQAGHTPAGAALVECADLSDAERYVSEYPVDAHGFATAGEVRLDATPAQVREVLMATGYSFAGGRWGRPGYTAAATTRPDGTASVFVSAAGAAEAWAEGERGYLPSGSRPTV